MINYKTLMLALDNMIYNNSNSKTLKSTFILSVYGVWWQSFTYMYEVCRLVL